MYEVKKKNTKEPILTNRFHNRINFIRPSFLSAAADVRFIYLYYAL